MKDFFLLLTTTACPMPGEGLEVGAGSWRATSFVLFRHYTWSWLFSSVGRLWSPLGERVPSDTSAPGGAGQPSDGGRSQVTTLLRDLL